MINHDSWLELAEFFALGSLDGDDLRLFENHLNAGCRDCEERVVKTEALLSELPSSLKQVTPEAAVKIALMKKIDFAPLPAFPSRIPRKLVFGAGIAIAAFTLLIPSWMQFSQPQVTTAAPAHDAAMTRILKSPDLGLVEFKDAVTGEKITAKLYWNPKACGGCFTIKGISKAGKGKIYELWAIAGGKPAAAGTFDVDKNGDAHLDIHALKEIRAFDKFAVTLEPEGGTLQPTGPLKFLSF